MFFVTTYQREKENLNLDQLLLNAIVSNEIGVDSEIPNFAQNASAPHEAQISFTPKMILNALTKGRYTRAFWLLILKLYKENPDFKTFIYFLVEKESVDKKDALQLKRWFKQKVVGGWYFPPEVNEFLSINRYEAFKQAKFMMLLISFRTYLYYTSQDNTNDGQ